MAKELGDERAEEDDTRVAETRARFIYRMHNLSYYMKTVLPRFTRWINRTHGRTGTLLGGALQERDCGERDCGADDGGVY